MLFAGLWRVRYIVREVMTMSRNIKRMPDAGHRDKVNAFVRTLESDPFVRKNLYRCEWMSGGQTRVSPISVCQDSVVLQWSSSRACNGWISKVVAKSGGLFKYGTFRKSDGSCPSVITFKLKQPLW